MRAPTRTPRPLLIAACVLLATMLALFTVALLHAQGGAREDAERRFSDKAKVSAGLSEALFGVTASQGAERSRERYGAARVDRRVLDRAARQGRSPYTVVVDHRGLPVGASSATPPAVLRRIAAGTPEVRRVLAGEDYWLSDVTPDGTVDYVGGFEAADGRRRALVSGVSPALLSVFLSGYLARIPGAGQARAYVLDSRGRVIGSPVPGQPAGAPVRDAGLVRALRSGEPLGRYGERVYAATGVGSSGWRVVLTERADTLYAGTVATVEWLILVALAAAGGLVVLLLRRSLRTAGALRGAYERLEVANAELARSNTELKRSNGELEQFASVASHDLQEPLRKVQTFGDQLERRFGDDLPDEAKDYLRRMRRAAGRMSTLIDDLLSFSRVTTHARPPKPIDLTQVARDVTTDLFALRAETHGDVRIGPLPTVDAEPLQMRQLLQNLIGNGLKFHRPGIPPVVEVRAVDAAPGWAAFEVADNGIGIAPQYLERIFRVFERLHPRDVYEGTGIGLALCRKITERHGGTIAAEAEAGAGSRFVVTLPAATVAAREPAGVLREPAHA